ncbi:MAG: hypothetical protein HY290_07060 [Planctomycetia bacterium]|nr:hypothetical protein [Planctomycetia bacterium]
MPEQPKPTIDERLETIVVSLELLSHEVHELKSAVQQDAENIRALVRIAEIHERRLSHLEEQGE